MKYIYIFILMLSVSLAYPTQYQGLNNENRTHNGDDVTDDFNAQFDTIETGNCHCNHAGGTPLISDALFEPSEVWINQEISQMIVDAKNESFFLKKYWTKGLAAEYNEFGPDALFSEKFLLPQEKLNFELDKRVKMKCLSLDAQINNLNETIIQIEQKLSLLR